MPIFRDPGQPTLAFSSKTLTLLVLVALGLDVLVLFVLSAIAGRRRAPQHGAPSVMDETLRGILEGHARTLQRLETAIAELSAHDTQLSDHLTGVVQNVFLVRYDAF